MADVTPERFIALQGPLNFRDLGGYTTREGRKVRWRKLFRSDGIHSMTADDVEQVYGKLGVITRIDLRTEREIERSNRDARSQDTTFETANGGTARCPRSDRALL